MDIRQRLLVVFQAEAKEHLARIRSILAKEGAATAGPNLDEVFRRAHSLKGAARAVDLKMVEGLAHPLETLVARIREGALGLAQPVLDTIHQVLDAIDDSMAAQVSGQTPAEPAQALAAMARLLDAKPSGADIPVRPIADSVSAVAPAAAAKTSAMLPEAETLRVSPAIIDRLHRSAGQLTTESMRQDLVTGQLTGLGRQIAQIDREWDQLRKTSATALHRMEADPELGHVSRFVEFLQHQLTNVRKDVRDLALQQRRGAWALRNIGDALQQDVCGARMILAEHVFDGFGKMMRDMARDEGKEIEFRATGLDIQADRFVLQLLKDPLMHLLRNTIAHGIENPLERERAGKKRSGTVALKLEAQGNKLVVRIEDDGRGVDLKNVVQAAVSKHLLTEAAAAALPPEEQMRLIFHPGITTTRAVTELSGRGLGLNIVSEAVTRLQGTVQVSRGETCGTVFSVIVPLAVSSSRLLFVKCLDRQFAIASHAVDRVVRVKTHEIASIEGRPAISFQGKLLPLTTLSYLLRLGESQVVAERETVPVAILKSGQRRAAVAVAVDSLVTEMECVIKDLSPIAMKAGGLSGGVVMGDGSVVLVLNAAELVSAFRRLDKLAVLKTAAPTPEKRIPTILVVDDSMTTRTLEKSILEAHGYRVIVAVDGIEALAQLRADRIDLVVSDIEMPRMDGFGLLQEIKKDANFARIPVLLVTSLENREDKERGLALGADGYIVKRKFDQMVLLDTVRQML